MARASEAGASDIGSGTDEPAALADQQLAEREEESSAGTSSSTSESRLDRSGSSTGTDLQSPAQSAENPSDRDQPQTPASYFASSTDGSGQETGSDQANLRDSSEESQVPTQATQALPSEAEPETQAQAARMLVGEAHKAFDAREYDRAEELLDKAEETDASVAPAVQEHRAAIIRARQQLAQETGIQGSGPHEEDPTAGGYLAGGTES